MGALVQDHNSRGRNPHKFGSRQPYMMRPRGPFPPPGPPMPMGMRPMMRPMPPPPRGHRMGPRSRGPMMGPRMRPPLPPPMFFRPRAPPPPMRGRWFGGGVRSGRVVKRRKAELDLGAEWVTEALREEFRKKDEMLGAAKASGLDDKEAWAAYRAQRERCGQMYHAARVEAVRLRQRQGQEVEDDSNKDTEAKTTKNLQTNNETSQPPAETTKTEVATS